MMVQMKNKGYSATESTAESDDTDDIVELIALKCVRIGADETNYRILEMLPSTINDIMKELKITKIRANSRVNSLERVDLIYRWRGTGIVKLTELGKFLMERIELYKKIVKDNEHDMLVKAVRGDKY